MPLRNPLPRNLLPREDVPDEACEVALSLWTSVRLKPLSPGDRLREMEEEELSRRLLSFRLGRSS
ncbi:hypothetical protein CSUI_007578 [Cystoisospora suis]|uniref:Uncharacterized protein n=1 Tax=Cystoisospora suis TaxID=483139 RepID=A0A2C6KDH1_9APIC|nr:hypothetical protein CSUI_007578 [Cystoisospora suis]